MENTNENLTDFERLLLAAKELKGWGTSTQIAMELTKAGYTVSDQIMTNWKRRGVSKEGKLRASAIIGCRPQWLDQGLGDMRDIKSSLGPAIQSPMRPVMVINNPDESEHELLQIPRYTLRASAGSGSPVFDICKEEEPNFFRASWAKRRGLNPEKLFSMHAFGDSMEPEIYDGDTLTVHKQSQIEYGKLMVICYLEECYVKRLLLQFDRSVVVKSSNPAYRDIHIPAIDVQHIQVVGRVVNVSHDE